MVTGLLDPGRSAEDDYPALEARLDGSIRLPVVKQAGADREPGEGVERARFARPSTVSAKLGQSVFIEGTYA
jgi:hypothetical protein